MNRRSFIKKSAGVALASVLAAHGAYADDADGEPATAPRKLEAFGVQLYSIRDMMQESVTNTLAAVAQAGYKEVEFAGYFDHSAADIQSMLDDNGLMAPSAHVPADVFDKKLDENL